ETFFTEVLILCGRAGMGALGHVAIDGTKVAANASKAAMADADRLRRTARRLIDEANAVDAAEDARYGEQACGDEVPEALRDPQRGRQVIDELAAAAEADPDPQRAKAGVRAAERAERVGQLLQELTERAVAKAEPALSKALARVEHASQALLTVTTRVQHRNAVREAQAADAALTGHRPPGGPIVAVNQHTHVRRATQSLRNAQDRLNKALELAETNTGRINMTDPDCRLMPTTGGGFIAGYNKQLSVAADYLILAVDVVQDTGDVEQLTPMLAKTDAAVQILRTARGEPDLAIGIALADCGYNS